jgi:uncharacterized metal-binding protein
MEIIREFSSDLVGICSLPALANEIPRQMLTVKNLEHLIVIDGCGNSCAKSLAKKLSLSYDGYVNLEDDLKIKKLGPFSTLHYSAEDVNQVMEAIKVRVKHMEEERQE